ncbi:PDZ domain-containing protein [Amycolatopsis palatopharyngis]|uniref:YlbL family protein n=1 Tax=Amycolatopsis palatopharyngis TaxID=187982 RepID=UPI00319E0B5F
MSESRDKADGNTQASTPPTGFPAPPVNSQTSGPGEPGTGDSGNRLSRRGWTLVVSGVLVVVFALLGTFVQVPYVALGPGPTYDTIGLDDGKPVVNVDGEETYPTEGELRMTTVSLNDEVTLFGALGLWVSGRYALAPREDYFKPGETDEEVKRENVKQFQDSQSNAEVAALRRLGYPVKVLAKEVVAGSPADHVLAAGDELVVVNGKKITKEEDVRTALEGTRPGETISLTYQHEGQPERTESVTLAQHEDPAQEQGFIGLVPIDRADVPFDINISLEDVGGPSAGLIFALAITDRLTPGSLVGGEHIAGTGEISEKGEVGAIGGISFKVVAASEAGATTFLVPERNCAEAAAAAPDDLNLVKVGDLDGALSALEDIREGRQAPSC